MYDVSLKSPEVGYQSSVGYAQSGEEGEGT